MLGIPREFQQGIFSNVFFSWKIFFEITFVVLPEIHYAIPSKIYAGLVSDIPPGSFLVVFFSKAVPKNTGRTVD